MPELHDDELHPSYIGMPTYLGTPFAVNAKELKSMNADIAIIGAPVDMGVVGRPGARYGPRAIRQADYWPKPAKLSNLYHLNLEVFPLKEMNVVDFGDANCPPSSLEKSHEAVENKVTEALDADAIPIVLGGDHSITWPSATAVAKKYGYGNVGMVHFDAHCDTGDDYLGSKFHHGAPFRRAVEEGLLDPQRTIQIGIRGPLNDPDVWKFSEDSGMRVVSIEEFYDSGWRAVMAEARKVVGEGPTYISFDVDGLDPVYAPGTGTPEVGGFTTHEAQQMIRSLRGLQLFGGDVVEVAPPFDPSGTTALVGASIMFEILCVVSESVASRK